MIDYKKIIKSRKMRLNILKFLSFIPDKPMIKLQYFFKTGRRLNLQNPKRFTEKIQWYKLYYKNPLMIQCVDKYDVREYVKSKGLEDILIPCYGVYNSPDEIDWDALPNQFVMKDTLGGGGTSVIIVKDKAITDIEKLKRCSAEWVKINAHKKNCGREWPYYSGKNHRIIIEKYLDADKNAGGLIDYKLLCFNGRPTIIYVLADRTLGNGAGCGIYDEFFNKLPCLELDERPLERIIEKPLAFELMKEIASKLSEDFFEARVDLYEVEGKVKFGEITFYDSSGYMIFEPDEFDEKFGEPFVLSCNSKKRGGGKLVITCYTPQNHGLIDYKFFCFNGRVQFLYVMGDRTVGTSVKVSIFDRDFKKLSVSRVGDGELEKIQKPKNYNRMLSIAEELSNEFPHARVDLYNENGQVLFGELTFYNASGYMKYEPDKFDEEIGEKFKLRRWYKK